MARGEDEDLEDAQESDRDDRAKAVNWYARRLLLQEQERGTKPAEIARATGLTKTTISHIMTDARSAGLLALIKLAPYFRRTQGELLDEALRWWESHGRKEAAAELGKKAAEARRRVEVAAKKRPSGQRPAVRLRGQPSSAPPAAKKDS
jgi:transcriptional regulator with XRE-family HTH domain